MDTLEKLYEEDLKYKEKKENSISKIQIKNKNGELFSYQSEKALEAIRKSASRCSTPLTDEEERTFLWMLEEKLLQKASPVTRTSWMHNTIIAILSDIRPDVSLAYSTYHDTMKKYADMMQVVTDECNSIMFIGDKSNSNADSALVSTSRVKQMEVLEKILYKNFFLLPDELKAIIEGLIYIHDMAARRDTMNCCLFNIKEVLLGGFEMGNIWYNEPKTLDVAFDVIGDIVLSAASQQYGGFTLPEIDDVLEIFAQRTYDKTYAKMYDKYYSSSINDQKNTLSNLGIEYESISEIKKSCLEKQAKETATELANRDATEQVINEMYAGCQGWEYKFNTVASSRGDYPFITVSFGLSNTKWGKLAAKAILETRKNGQGKKEHKKPVLFPKLVFLYDKNLHGPGKEMEDLFETGIECSAETMYPDWLSLTGEGYIASMYKKYGLAISPMGCRAFLSPWYEKGGINPADENDVPVFKGRFNIGAISLNLPMILQKARMEELEFHDILDYYLNMIRQIHIRTYAYLGKKKASSNPLAYCEGGFYGGKLKLNDEIKPLLKSATASFGITAFNELQMLYNGKSLVEDGQFTIDTLDYINKKINEFKEADGNLYAIYGTPAESLCGLQVQQFRKKYGIIEGVSDKEYVSNSFHCHVTEDISPVQKQDLEYRFWEKCNGGKIQYVKYHTKYNLDAFRTMIRRAMKMGLYEGVNLSLAYCEDCGHEELEMDVCSVCGSHNLTKIERMNGYLSYSRVNGDTRLNEAKMAEIEERISM